MCEVTEISLAGAEGFRRGAPRGPALVQGRHHLRGARQGVLRLGQRRHRRLHGPHAAPRLHTGPGRHGDLAHAVLPLADARRRLRHLRVQERPPRLRHHGGTSGPSCARRTPGPPGDHRAGHQPHLRRAPLVPARPRGTECSRSATSTSGATPGQVRGHAHHLHGHGEIQLDLGRGGQASTTGTASSPTSRT